MSDTLVIGGSDQLIVGEPVTNPASTGETFMDLWSSNFVESATKPNAVDFIAAAGGVYTGGLLELSKVGLTEAMALQTETAYRLGVDIPVSTGLTVPSIATGTKSDGMSGFFREVAGGAFGIAAGWSTGSVTTEALGLLLGSFELALAPEVAVGAGIFMAVAAAYVAGKEITSGIDAFNQWRSQAASSGQQVSETLPDGSVVTANPDQSYVVSKSGDTYYYDQQGKLTDTYISSKGIWINVNAAGVITATDDTGQNISVLVSTDSSGNLVLSDPASKQLLGAISQDSNGNFTIQDISGNQASISSSISGNGASYSHIDSNGNVTTDTVSADGNEYVSQTSDANGQIVKTTRLAVESNNSISSYTQSQDGSSNTSYYDASQNETTTNWASADGASGTQITEADGSYMGVWTNSDGTTGNNSYDATTGQLSAQWTNPDHTSTTLVSDKSGTLTTYYDASGKEIGHTWQQNSTDPQSDGLKTLTNALTDTVDALSLLKAIQTGQPLPITVSGLRLASDFNPGNTDLAGAAAVGSGILSLMSLDNALKQNDTLAAITAGAQVVNFGVTAYADFVDQAGKTGANAVSDVFGKNSAAADIGEALPYLSLINSIAHGDALGAAASVADIAMMAMGMVPVVGEVVAVFEIVSSLFGSDNSVPDPWGSGRYVWNGAGVSVQAEGQTGGDTTVSSFLNNELSVMNTLVSQEEAQHPGSPLGIIPNRMPTLGYGMDGYHFTDIDPVTGVQKDPSLRYDTSGMPYNATPGTPEASMSLGQAFLESALARGAIAPEWEVQTAEMQTQIGDPQAGLTEVERAGRAGDLAAPETGSTTTWRPVVLDMSGNGIQITPKAQSGVAFNVDDSGYLKSTDWIGSGDAFLTLDRTDSGSIDTSSDLFSNGAVGLDRRGLAGLAWVDANDDGVIDASDPVFSQLRIWQDANGDGVAQPGEMLTMQQAGITSLNYAMGTFTLNGQVHQMASPDLNADTLGEKTTITPSGILLQNSNGQTSLVVTRIDDVQTNEVAVSGYENTELIVSAADILAHDTVGGVSSNQLSMTGLIDFRHGTGYIDTNNFIHFTPDANYYGSDAGFDYGVTAPNAQSTTGKVDINIQHINQPPTPGPVSLDSRPVYGYTPIQYDDYGGYLSGGNPIYQPYVVDNSQVPPVIIYNQLPPNVGYGWYEYHTTPIAYEDTGAGQVHATDVDDPASSLTYKVLSQPEYGSVTVNPDGTFQYTSWKQPNVASDDIVVDGQYAAVNGSTLYTQSNLPSYAVYPTTDVFQVQITDPEGATTTESVTVPHFGPYVPPTPPGGGGKKPIAIDLSQQGFNFTNVQDSNVFMDVNGDGWKHRISWIAPGEGLLAYNPNGATTMDINQVALVNDAPGAQTDLQALAAFDSNHDGVFDKNDAAWSKFGVWVATDTNGGAVFKTLDQLGIASISLTSNGQFSTINGDTVHGIATVTMTDGTTRNAADVTLAYSNQIQVTNPDGTTSVVTPTSLFGTGEVDGDPAGNNLLLGYNGNTVIKTGDGNNNVVFSGDGNDVIQAGAGSNVIYAGNGDDLITAGDGNNVIYTGHGNDVILVGNGQNAIFGGGGNDVIFAGNGNNLIAGGNGNDVIRVGDGNNTIYTGDGNTAVFAGNGDNVIQAGAGTTQIQVGSGNNTLIAGAGPTTMVAGSGNNTFQINSTEDSIQVQAGGINTVVSSISYVLPENIQNLTLTGNDNLTGTGNDLDNVIIGNAGTDTLIAGSGNDTLIAGSGVATMIGGSGNDTFVVNNTADVVEAQAGSNINTVLTSVSYVAPANVQILTGTGSADITLTGNDLTDTLTANSGNDTLVAGSGVATMIGGSGNDTFVVNNVADVVEAQASANINTVLTSVSYTAPANVQVLTGTGSADITLTGNDLTDTLTANSGNDTLIAGSGVATLIGGAGNDTFVVNNVADVVEAQAGSNINTVLTSVSYTAPVNVQFLTGTGNADITLTGNDLTDTITANSGNDTLIAGSGVATLIGGAGNDTFVVNNVADVVEAQAGSNVNTVLTSVSYTAPANVQVLTGTGTADITLTGNDLADTLTANSGNDTLVAGSGVATMIGGAGNDTFVVNNTADIVEAQADGNINTVLTSVSYTAPANVQVLTGTGTADITLTGNDLTDTITANSGNDTLIAGSGVATMIGGSGNDTFVVNNAADVVEAQAGGNVNTVLTSVSYTAPANVQILTGTGTADITLTGNDLTDTITANSGNDTLVAGSGVATMIGGSGNDTFVVNNTADVVEAQAGSNINTVLTSVSYTAPANVQILTGTGTADITLTGNNLNDVITANAGNDTLIGQNSNNTFIGGAGNNTMIGGTGNDTYVYNLGNGLDTVTDSGGQNTVKLGAGLSLQNVVVRLTRADGTPYLVNADTGHGEGGWGEGDWGDCGHGNSGTQTLTAHLRVLDANGVEQSGQGMDFTVTVDRAGNFTTPLQDFLFSDGTQAVFADMLVKQETLWGRDVFGNVVTGRNDDTIYANERTTSVTLGSGNDTVYAATWGTTVQGGGGNDVLIGSLGHDQFTAGYGLTLMQGGAFGQDTLTDTHGQAAMWSGGDSLLTGGGGNDFFGSGGGDTIATGATQSVVAVNAWQGADTLLAAPGAANTLSLGGGIDLGNLSFRKIGNDLVLSTNACQDDWLDKWFGTGSNDEARTGAITLKDWYASTANHDVATLQVIEEASDSYRPRSSDPLRNQKIEEFDFGKLVSEFDTARTANPQLSSWNLMNGLLDAHLSGSNTAAMGGDLAYQFGLGGDLSTIGVSTAQATLKDPGFGGMQTLKTFQGLPDNSVACH